MHQFLKNKSIVSLVMVLFFTFVILTLLGRILIPFIVALILTYIVNPLVEKMYKKFKIKRTITSFFITIIVFLLFLAIPFYIIPSFISELKIIFKRIPELIVLFNKNILENINAKYGTHLILNLEDIKTSILNHFTDLYNQFNLSSPIAKNTLIIFQFLGCIVLVPFILFFSIVNWHKIINFFDILIPRSHLKAVHTIIKDIDKMLAAYLRGQLSVMIIMAFYYALTLKVAGLHGGIVIGFIVGLLVFIPYLGLLSGFIITLTIALANFTSMNQIYIIFVIFIIGHVLESSFITPFLVGGKIGLNPVLIILALLIFSKLFGIVGVLLALPLSAITVVLLKHARLYYLKSNYYKENN